jgi:IS4 transposase
VSFVVSVSGQALKERWAEQKLICSKVFNRVIIEDSSQAKTHVNNAEDFPGHGMGNVKTAGCKSDLAFDLLTGEPLFQTLHLATDQDRELGKQPSNDMLLRDSWYLLITNIGEDLMGCSDLFKLYATRWQIEITFRAWKQAGQLIKALARDTNEFHLQCLMYAAIIILILTMKTASLLRQQHARYRLSIEKLADDLGSHILTLLSLDHFGNWQSWAEVPMTAQCDDSQSFADSKVQWRFL